MPVITSALRGFPQRGRQRLHFTLIAFLLWLHSVRSFTVRGPVKSEKMLHLFLSTSLFLPELEDLGETASTLCFTPEEK